MENFLKENLKFKSLSLHHRNITFKSSFGKYSHRHFLGEEKRMFKTCERERERERKYERITKSLKINIIKKELYQVEQQQKNEGA